jgi:hypothetical protein
MTKGGVKKGPDPQHCLWQFLKEAPEYVRFESLQVDGAGEGVSLKGGPHLVKQQLGTV